MKKVLLKSLAVIVAIFFASQTMIAQTLTPKKDAKKPLWGYVDSNDKWVIKPKYDEAGNFTKMPDGKMQAVVAAKGLKGYIDESGKALGAGLVFQDITPIDDNTLFVSVKGKKGVIDSNRNYIVKPEIEQVSELSDNNGYIVTIKGEKGVMKKDGTFVLQPVYTDIFSDNPGYFKVNMNGKAGVYSQEGNTIIEPKDYTDVIISGDRWIVSKGNKKGIYNPESKRELIKPKYDDINDSYFRNTKGTEFFIISKGEGKQGLITAQGSEKLRPQYKKIEFIPDFGYIATSTSDNKYLYQPEVDKRYDIVNSITKQVGKFTYSELTLQDESKQNYSYKTLKDENGKELGEINTYSDGLLSIKSPDGTVKLISDNGMEIASFSDGQVTDIASCPGFFLITLKDGTKKLLSDKGIEIVNFPNGVFRGVASYKSKKNNYIGVNNSKYELFDTSGNKYVPTQRKFMGTAIFHSEKANKDILIQDRLVVDAFDYYFNNNQVFKVVKDNKVANIDFMGIDKLFNVSPDNLNFIEESSYELFKTPNKTIYKYIKDGKWGLKDQNKILLPAEYTSLKNYSNDKFIQLNKNDSMGVYDLVHEKFLIPLNNNYYRFDTSDIEKVIDGKSNLVSVYGQPDEKYAMEYKEYGVWNCALQKEVAPLQKDKIYATIVNGKDAIYYPHKKEYYMPDGSGKKFTFTPSIELVKKDTGIRRDGKVQFTANCTGMQGKSITFTIHYYNAKGVVQKDAYGKPIAPDYTEEIPEDNNYEICIIFPVSELYKATFFKDLYGGYGKVTAKYTKTGQAIQIKNNTNIRLD